MSDAEVYQTVVGFREGEVEGEVKSQSHTTQYREEQAGHGQGSSGGRHTDQCRESTFQTGVHRHQEYRDLTG